MLAELKSKMLVSAAAPAFPADATVGVVWGLSVREILQVVMDKAIELEFKNAATLSGVAAKLI